MNFGLYIGSATGTDTGLAIGLPDDPVAIQDLLHQLDQGKNPIIVRAYIHFTGSPETMMEVPEKIMQYATAGRKIDLVLCYRSPTYNKAEWTNTIREVIEKYGDHLCSIQITEEPNLKTVYAADGSFENVDIALHDGILAARESVNYFNLPTKVGFNTVLSFNPADNFWNIIGSDDYHLFRDSIDYVGLDFFPDVFRPIPEEGFAENLRDTVKKVVSHFRNTIFDIGKIRSSVPIHITENGWPTGAGKSPHRQALVLETIITALHDVKEELNIASYELFGLRDTDSSNDNLFYQFGIVKDDYSPKPAFYKFQDLIKNFG